MYRASLLLVAALVLCTIGVRNAPAADSDDGSMDTLSAYLHGHRMPLVEARMVTNQRGDRSVLLYGYVATPYGKSDAEEQTRDYLDDPDVTIVNRIQIKPELLTLGTATDNSGEAAQAPSADGLAGAQAAPGQETPSQEAPSDAAGTAVATGDFPDVIGDREAYANQERDEELLTNNGALIGGMPLAVVILGSGSIFPPILPSPIYYNRMPSPFVSAPVFHPPVYVMRPLYNPPPFRGFPPPVVPGISPYPAGPAPMFPATVGRPFATTINPGFGFAQPGFAAHGGFGGGFGGGRGFGGFGHR